MGRRVVRSTAAAFYCSLTASVADTLSHLLRYILLLLSSLLLHRDGRLQEGDQILAIDGQLLDANISHKQAIHILQKAHGLVEVVVARGQDIQASAGHNRAASSASGDMVGV